MNAYVLDTSVTLAWYLSEEFSPAARSWQDELLAGRARFHFDARLEVAEPERPDVLKTAFDHAASVYDSVFIALALERDLPLLSAERTTTRWVSKLGKRVVSVR